MRIEEAEVSNLSTGYRKLRNELLLKTSEPEQNISNLLKLSTSQNKHHFSTWN